jgi:hypothetical protein
MQTQAEVPRARERSPPEGVWERLGTRETESYGREQDGGCFGLCSGVLLEDLVPGIRRSAVSSRARHLSAAAAVGAAFAERWALTARPPAASSDALDAARDAPAAASFVYVDGFAGDDLRRGGAETDGRALHTLRTVERALAARRGATLAAVLVEEDPAVAQRLADALRAGGVDVHLADAPPDALEAGARWVVRGAFRDHAGALAGLGDAAAVLAVLMPGAAGQMPVAPAAPLLAAATADVLVRVPTTDFVRLGETSGPVADLPPHLRRTLDGCAGLLGTAAGAWLPALRSSADPTGFGRDRCRASLALAGGRDAKPTLVRDAEGDEASLVLLATRGRHDLALNDAIRASGAVRVSRDADDPARPTARDLFGEPVASAKDGFDVGTLTRRLGDAFRGRIVTAGEVVAEAAVAGAGWDDLRSALARLRRDGALRLPAVWDEDTRAEFPRVREPPRRAPRPASPPGDLPLFAAVEAGPAPQAKRRGGRARARRPRKSARGLRKPQGRWSTPQPLK